MSTEAVAVHDQVAARVAVALAAVNGRRRARPVPVDAAMRLVAAVAAGADCAWDDGGRLVGQHRPDSGCTLVLVARVGSRVALRAVRVNGISATPGRGWSGLRSVSTIAAEWARWVAEPDAVHFSGPELDAVQEARHNMGLS